jgi:hypothetical protein
MFATLGLARVQFGLVPQVPVWMGWSLLGTAFLMGYTLYLRILFYGLFGER